MLLQVAAWLLAATLLVIAVHDWRRPTNCIPGPVQLPFVLNLPTVVLNMKRLLHLQMELARKHGRAFCLTLPFLGPLVFFSDPQDVESMLGVGAPFEKGEFFRYQLQDVLGDGIFNADGDVWRVQRKTASRLFRRASLRDYITAVFNTHTSKLLSRLDAAAADGCEVQLDQAFFDLTLGAIGEIAFGVELDDKQAATFGAAFDRVQNRLWKRFVTPWWPIMRLLKLGSERHMAADLRILKGFCRGIIEARRGTDYSQRQDLLSFFMAEGKVTADLILNFVIAGRDTTAQALAWSVYSILTTDGLQQRLRKEVTSVLRDDDSLPGYGNVGDMTLLTATVMEALRLYPSVPVDVKRCTKKITMPCGVTVHPGEHVAYMPWAMGRLTRVWGEDAQQFKPERWLEEGEHGKQRVKRESPFKFASFQAGPRVCLGQEMALLELRMTLSRLLRTYELSLVPGQHISYRNSLTLPISGLRVRVKRL